MKRLIVCLAMLIGANLMTEPVNLDDAVTSFLNRSKLSDIGRIEKELSDRRVKQAWLNRVFTLSLSPTGYYNYWPFYTSPKGENGVTISDNPYGELTLSPTFSCFDLSFNAGFHFERFRSDLTSMLTNAEARLGLVDLFYYSRSKYVYRMAVLEKEKADVLLASEEVKNIESLIAEYVEIVTNQDYIQTLSDGLEELENTKTNLLLRSQTGTVSDLDLTAINLEVEKTKKDIEITATKLKMLKERFCEKVGLVYDEALQFSSIDEKDFDKIVLDSGSVKAKRIELRQVDEKGYNVYRGLMPDFGLATGLDPYDSSLPHEFKDRFFIGLFLTWEPLSYLNMEEKPYDITRTKEKLEKSLLIEEEEYENRKKELDNRYRGLIAEITVAEQDLALWRRRVQIKREMYESGLTDLLDYLKSRNSLRKSEKALNEQKNELFGLKYRMAFISSIEAD